jgi:hypothetical protein
MGFFKKIFKGVKKVFKKIGSGIKKAVSKVGKFMGKLGIVGQIGLGLILPGIGSMMGSMFGKLATSLMSSTYGVVRGAGQVINAAINIGTGAGNVFKSVTEGVSKVIGEVAGATLNKLGVKNIGKISLENKGFKSIWDTASTAIKDVAAKGGDLFSMDTLTADNVFMKKAAETAASGAVSPDGGVFDVPGMVETPAPQSFAAPDGGVFDVPGMMETPVPEGTLGDAVEGFRAAQEVSAPAVAAVQQPSLLSKAGTALSTRAKEAVTGIPEQFSKAAIANLTAIPRDIVRSAMAPTPEVTYDVRQAAIPDIGFAGIGSEFAQPAFDPVSYFNQNESVFSQNPFGFGARMYSEASYAQNMRGYGFQVPMYGMA